MGRLKGLASLIALALVCAVPLAGIWHAATVEHDRRAYVLKRGAATLAVVTESYWSLRHRSCRFRYIFLVDGVRFEGGEGGCPLVDTHPVGTTLSVRFDPADPAHSIPVGADLWPGWAAMPPLLALALLPLAGVFAYAIIRNPVRAPKRGKAR